MLANLVAATPFDWCGEPYSSSRSYKGNFFYNLLTASSLTFWISELFTMTDLATLRAKRATVRTKVTKNIKAAEKFLTDDIPAVKIKELQSRLQAVEQAV